MPTYDVLLRLRSEGIEVRLDADGRGLRVHFSSQPPSEAALAVVRDRTREIVEFLKQATLAREAAKSDRTITMPASGSASLIAPAESATPRRAPLTHGQRRLWLLERLQPGTSAYSLPYAFRLSGTVDVQVLAEACRELVCQHDALRTTIGEDADGPYLKTQGVGVWSAEIVRFPQQLEQLLSERARTPFDLTKGPLFRANIYVLAENEVVLFFNVHHIVCDGWSIEIMLRDLQLLYRAGCARDRAALPAPAILYAEHVHRESELLAGAEVSASVARACGRLKGIPPLELPTDRPRPPMFRYRGDVHRFTLEPELAGQLKQLARERAVTSYMLLLAAYQVLLHRYSGQTDIVVGSPFAGREQVDTEGVVGFFANTLVMRVECTGEQRFCELLQRTKETCLTAFEDRLVPFERLVEVLNPPRDRSRTPIFQVIFTFQETAPRELDPALVWERLTLCSGGAKTDLTLLLEDDGRKIVGWLEYNADLFEPDTIARLGENFQTLLHSILARPEEPVGRLAILSEGERAALARLNKSARDLPPINGFHELIAAQARKTPNRIAVADERGQLTYRQLEERSSYWACELLARGISRGARVGIAVERTRHLVELVLAVLKVGAAYVPLEISYPSERLAYMIDDSALALIIAGDAARARLFPVNCQVMIADPEGKMGPTTRAVEFLPLKRRERAASDTAYVIYTSGSTGKPKGVLVPHRAVVNFLTSMARVPGCTEDDRVMALTTLSFDIAVLELFLPLTVGARTIIAADSVRADGAALQRSIDKLGATIVQATPATWRLLLAAGLPKRIRTAISGGEPFPPELARALVPRCDQVWNGYGPTETTVYSSFYRVRDPDRPILIGRPIDNTRLYVLDEHLTLVPFGVTGELYIGGLGVSAGYLGKPELTASRFVPDPFARGEDARLYRTGDLARMRQEGVQFLGRADDQVKLRGYRIELGEIEAVLSEDEAVAHCAVAVREFGADDRRLVAYLVGRKKMASVDVERIRARARALLPEYMVPSHFTELPALPMTPNRKVDRKKLPVPSALLGNTEAARVVVAADPIERVLCRIWARVLGTRPVRVTDNFFALGGHSLLALKLIQEINRECNVSLPLSVVFEAPTVREQARVINSGEHGSGVSIIELQPGGPKPPLFCLCGINLYQNLAKHLRAVRPIYGMFLPIEAELLEGRALNLSVREMSRQYVAAIRARAPRGPYHLLGISFGGVLAYEVAQQLKVQGQEVGLLALLDVVLDHAIKRRGLGMLRSALAPALQGRFRSVFDNRLEWLGRFVPGLRTSPIHDAMAIPVDADAIELAQTRLQSYRRAWAEYAPTMVPFDGSALVLRAREELARMSGCWVASDYGWCKYVRHILRCYDVPGTHLGILDEPHVREVAALVDKFLAEAEPTYVSGARARLWAEFIDRGPPGYEASGPSGIRSS